MNRLVVMTNMNVDGMRVHNETWAQQLKDAMNVNGGDIENASAGDYVMHFLTFGFKILFALVPPAGRCQVGRKTTELRMIMND